jgi:ribosomal protein S8E
MAVLRSVAKTDTFEIQRQKINLIAQDVYDVQTTVGEGGFSLSNGSVTSPSLFFTNQPSVGIYKGIGKSLNLASNGKGIVSFEEDFITAFQDIRSLISSIPTGTSGVTISNSGSNYNSGTYTNVPLTGGSGNSAYSTVTVSPMNGSVTSDGIRYVGGTYTNVPLTGGSGSGAQATIVVSPFGGNVSNQGSGGSTTSTFTNVALTGGGGSGLLATVVTSQLPGGSIVVSSVTITNFGSGTYAVGNILSASSGSIGGVTGFQYTLTGVGEVSSVTITNGGSGYIAGDILSASSANLGGSGTGFQYTVNKLNFVSSVEITNGGDGYVTGDVLSVRNYELYPTVIKYVKLEATQLLSFSGTYPTSGFAVNSNLTFNGQTRRIVKVFTSGPDITAVSVDATSGSIPFPGAGQTATSGGQSATVSSSSSALNYYFSDTENPNNASDWTNIPDFTFRRNERYLFIQKASSNNTHPLRFSITRDGFHTSGGVTYNGSEVNYDYVFPGAIYTIEIIPDSNTPSTLYYFCGEGITDPFNNHLDEGGFDNKEGVITVSGSITPSLGSGFQLVLGNITEEQNVLIERTGNTSIKDLTATTGLFSQNLTCQQNFSLSGDLTIGVTKLTVDSSTGDTYIDGDLEVNGELNFLNDASLGGTLYIDSINNRVSINRDPDTTPLTYDLEIDGSLYNSDNSVFSAQSGTYTRIGSGLSGTEKLQVGGSIYSSEKFLGSTAATLQNPQYSFSANTRHGIHFNDVDKETSIVSSNGKLLGFKSNQIDFYRNTNFNVTEITEINLNGGSGYTDGTYNGILLTGGTGNGAAANVIVAFSLPIGSISTVNNISAADPLKDVGIYTVYQGDYTTIGDGEYAVFEITIDGTGAASVVIIEGGRKFSIGDTVTVPGNVFTSLNILQSPQDVTFTVNSLTSNPGAGYTDATYENVPLTGGSGTGAFATIVVESGVVTEAIVTNAGTGYVVGNTLSFSHTSLQAIVNGSPITSVSPTTTASLKIEKLGTISKVDIINYGDGYIVGDVLQFNNIAGSPTSTASLSIEAVSSTTTITIDKNLGNITALTLKTTGSGINVDDVLSIDSNNISSLNNSDIIISPGSSSRLLSVSGTGGIKLPVGNSTNRPAATTAGIVRYNTQTSQYEGSNGTNFISLGGVRDVDGNTYIIAEEETGANDNILYFFNDNYNSARLNRTELELVTSTTISSKDTDGKFKWKANTAYSLNAFVYHETNLYQVTTAGTTESVAPSHTTGSATNGTVTLNYIGDTYGDLTLKAKNINLNGGLTLSSALKLYSLSNNLVFENSDNSFKFAFGNISGVPDVALSISNAGQLRVNKNFDTSNPENNINVIDYTAKFIELDDVKIQTSDLTLTRGATDSGNITAYNPSNSKGAKIIMVAENTTTGDSHIVEYNIISKGTDIYVNEYGNLDTGIEQYSVVWNFDPSNNIQGSITLNNSLTAGNVVIITSSITQIKK